MILFLDKVRSAQAQQGSTLLVNIAPWPAQIPHPLLRHDDPFLPYSKAVIDATADFSVGYVFDFAAFLCVGASGAIALERALAYVPSGSISVLNGQFASASYMRAASESAFYADAVTITTQDVRVLQAWLRDPAQGILLDSETAKHSSVLPDHAVILRDCEAYHSVAFNTATGIPPLRWFGDVIGFASRAEDYKEAIRAAAFTRRTAEHCAT